MPVLECYFEKTNSKKRRAHQEEIGVPTSIYSEPPLFKSLPSTS